jgi:hypothetical protein
MNVYKLSTAEQADKKTTELSFLGLYTCCTELNRRYLAVNLDPVLACNLRCKMCYFTDADYVKDLKRANLRRRSWKQVAKVGV